MKNLQKLLEVIENNPKISANKLSAMLGIPLEQVKKQIQDLEEKQIIKGYRTIIAWEKLGKEKVCALVEVKVQPERGVGFDDVAERVKKFPEVKFLYLVSGTFDFLVLVEGNTMQEVSNFVAQKLATQERVQGTITHFVLKKYKEEGELENNFEDKRQPIQV